MSHLLRFLMTIVLTLGLVLGQGMVQTSEATMACCQKLAAISHESCCPPVKKPIKLSSKTQTCFCQVPDGITLNNFSTKRFQSQAADWVISSDEQSQNLQVTDSDLPIWVYWQFQPDRSRLYQQKNSWLL